jgi:hypothetical protein
VDGEQKTWGGKAGARQLSFGLLELKKAYSLIIYTRKLFLRVPQFAKSLNDLSELEITARDGDISMLLLKCGLFSIVGKSGVFL